MIGWLADQCKQHLLTEKWLLAQNLRIAGQWKDRLNLAGNNTINLHAKTLPTIALTLAGNQLAGKQLRFANQSTVRMLVRNLFCRLRRAGKLVYFHDLQFVEGLTNLLTSSIGDLRLAGMQPDSLLEQGFDSSAKAADLRQIYCAYCDLLGQQRIADYAAGIELAIQGLADGSIQLPSELLILMPEAFKSSLAERRLLETLATKTTLLHSEHLDACSVASAPVSDLLAVSPVKFEYFAGLGEVNEVRGVFQRILSQQDGPANRLDQAEILHTDYQQYVPLVLEQLTGWLAAQDNGDRSAPDLDKLPVTFAEGIACIYSRPGRALRGWLRWARLDYIQTRAVQLIREGLLMRPPIAESIGYSRLASSLRQIPIGFQADRYLPKINEAIQSAQQSLQEYQQNGDHDGAEAAGEIPQRDFGLPSLQAVLAMVQPLIKLAPSADDDATTVLNKARKFLLQCARADNKLDRYAREKLLDDIDGMLANFDFDPEAELDVLQWLEELPIESRIMASGPLPGRVHVAPLLQGGHSGRKQLFVMGLDDGRYPKRIGVDPVLLDAERERLSTNLPTSQQVAEEIQQSLDRALYRALAAGQQTITSSPLPPEEVGLSGPGEGMTKAHDERHQASLPAASPDEIPPHICLSYSLRNLAEDRASFPSASMLELFRITQQNDDAHMDDLLAHIGPPVAFASRDSDDHLSPIDCQLSNLLGEPNPDQRQQWLQQQFAHKKFVRFASQSHQSAELTEYDGLVPMAGTELDPTAAERVSPSGLETYGVCPRRFLFARGLGVYPPDEWVVDRERWLDPLQFGNFVHLLFEQFLRELTQQDRAPRPDQDLQPLLDLLHSKINDLKSQIPVPNQDAFRRTHDLLAETCEIFLAKEAEYCREHDARPWVLEASLGLDVQPKTELDCPEPIPLALADGRVIHLGGRLDRVDQLLSSGSQHYAIWDYKTGSSYGFDQEKPFQQGRKLQPYLYVGMLRHRIATLGGGTDAVESFGYFFPTPKTDGLRLRWTRAELRSGDDVLQNICDLITNGVFLPTTDAKDCTYCDYLSVCGDADVVAAQSLWKSSQACNQLLEPWRKLRDIDSQGAAS